MNNIKIIQDDYQHFPANQTFDIYAENVYFKDPLVQFRGIQIYKAMINFMNIFFKDVKMDLHEIHQTDNIIHTQWTLNWTTPLPWKPRIAVPGRSELTVDENNLIVSHIDYWDCSKLDVVKQHLSSVS